MGKIRKFIIGAVVSFSLTFSQVGSAEVSGTAVGVVTLGTLLLGGLVAALASGGSSSTSST